MPFAPEVEQTLKDWGFSPEEMAQVEPVLGKPERQEKIKGSVLRQAEFSRKMQALDKQKQDAEAALAEKERIVAEDAASLGTWKQTADKTLADNQKALEESRLKVFKYQEKMKSLATQYGVDVKELEIEAPAPTPDPKPVATHDPSEFDKRYLSREDAEKLRGEMRSLIGLPGTILKITREHEKLFGKELDPDELVANALRNKRTLREEWEVANEVPKRRDELKEKEIQARIDARVAEARTQLLSEHKLPVTRGADSGSPILGMRDQLKLEGTDRTKLESTSAVDAAVAAYNTGKYKGVVVPSAGGEKS